MKKILQKEAPVLRQKSQNIVPNNIRLPKIQKIIKEMKMALDSQDDGVALAAAQIGYPLRMFIISKKVFEINKIAKEGLAKKGLEAKESPKESTSLKNLIFINPIIKKISKEKKTVEEGCLSVRYLYGKVKRGNKAVIEALDENGKKFERGGTGLLAQIFQHEVDHLDGILFIDKAEYVEEILPEKNIAKKI